VVIPAWNAARTLADALASVQAQTFRDFEAVIVDDGSTDDTPAIARRFCEADSRFILRTQTHAGVSVARNHGIRQSRGNWIAFLDADDVWLPEKLERQMALSYEDPRANFVFTNFYFWDGQRNLGVKYADRQPLPEGNPIRQVIFDFVYLPSAVVVRREILLDAGLFDPELLMSQDRDMWMRIAERGLQARGVREPLVRYRRWPGSRTVANRLKSTDYNARAIEKNLHSTQRPELIPLYRGSLAEARISHERIRARQLVEADPDVLPPVIWRIFRVHPRIKWLRWYACLVWPRFLGGEATRQYVHRRIRERWPITGL
jgi:glycosyltransferase involved in cell wall biosynthesis